MSPIINNMQDDWPSDHTPGPSISGLDTSAIHRPIRAGASRAVMVLAGAAGCALVSGAAGAAIQFDDVTSAAGVTYVGESYGSAWGDYNADGWPDVFVSHHRNPPGLYVNLGDGTFENRAGEVEAFQVFLGSDQHGASWSDFDNDGDNDFFVSVGRREFPRFLVNDGQFLIETTANYKLNVKTEGRLPVWFDFNHDGKLDVAMSQQGSKPILYEQTANDFVPANSPYGNNCVDTDFTQLADVTRDGFLDWLCITQSPFPEKVYDIQTKPFTDRTSLFPPGIANSTDSFFGDIDGDLVSDAFALRGKETISGAAIVGPQAVEAHLVRSGVSEVGTSFQSTGDLSIEMHWSARNINNVFIGASGMHPPAPVGKAPIQFTLSAASPDVHGLKPRNSNPGKDSIYVGYDPATQTWQFWNVSAVWSYVYAYIDSTQPVSNLQQFGLIVPLDLPSSPIFLGSSTGSYVNRTSAIGMNTPLLCNSVVAADFDNDMDLDLYFVCRNAVTNAADRLFENVNGVFAEVAGAGGAAGPTGPGVGLGENVSIADFDVDGRVDVLVHNGLALFPEIPWSNGGPDKLFRNVSTGNHWIEIDLVGTTSNRDAVGARVVATAGGVDQLREQGGNYRRWTQNHKRLHFGLGVNPTVDLAVTWPDGVVQNFSNLAADKLYSITQGADIEEVVLGPVGSWPCGEAAGLPGYNPAFDPGVFMGKDCVNGGWKLRVSGGGGAFINYRGEIVSSEPFLSVTGVTLDGGDTLDTSDPNIIEFALGVGGGGDDGIDFSFPIDADVCFDLDNPVGASVKVGNNGRQVSPPFDLGTLEACEEPPPPPPPPPEDPECGEPDFNEQTETGVFIWRNCEASGPGAEWHARLTGGGSAWSPYEGSVTSDLPLGATGFRIVSPDEFDAVPDDETVEFRIWVGGDGVNGFQLDVAAGAQACFEMTELKPGAQVQLGAARQVMGSSFDFETLEACGAPPPPPPDPECGQPNFNPQTETGVFIWRNCGAGGPGTEWHARVTGGGTAWSPYVGSVTSDMPLGATGFRIVSPDEFDAVPGDETVEFRIWVGGDGVNGFSLDVAEGAQACFEMTQLKPGAQVQLGAGRQVMGSSFDLETFEACGAPPPPPPDPECGEPDFDEETETGVFIWRNCEAGGAGSEWHARLTGGGAAWSPYEGSVTSDLPLGATGFRIVSPDEFDAVPNDETVEFRIWVGGNGVNGFTLDVAEGAQEACLDMTELKPGAQVQLGAGRQVMGSSFDLLTFEACN